MQSLLCVTQIGWCVTALTNIANFVYFSIILFLLKTKLTHTQTHDEIKYK